MPWDPCPAEIVEGKFCCGRYKGKDGLWHYQIKLDQCPLTMVDHQTMAVLRAGRAHAIDRRTVDVAASSADLVDLVLEVSAWARGQAATMAMVAAAGRVIGTSDGD